jgi:thiol:disulfide interchange protein/DsbC/DsbD-like thiol-disulfide interchange protein
MRTLLLSLLFLTLAAASARAAESASVVSKHATASLVAASDSVGPDGTARVALRLRLAPGWHTYWRNPGDAGTPPALAFSLPAGFSAGAIEWPAPERIPEGPLMTYGYRDEVMLPVTLTGPAGALAVGLHAEWLVCAKVCIPESGDFRLDLPAGDGAPGAEAALFTAAAARMPRPSPWAATIGPDGALTVTGPRGVRDAYFFADAPDAIAAAAPQTPRATADGLRLALRPGPAFRAGASLAGVLALNDSGGTETFLRIEAKPGAAAPEGDGVARLLGLAFLGGLILNLMPCVFPVLAIKVAGLAGLAGARRGRAALYGASYAAGVLITFGALGLLLLALRAGGSAVGWGFQFQSPAFVAAIAWLLFAVGLNFSGLMPIGGRAAGVGQALAGREGPVGSFFTGLLAVLVASPCTAPFMGAAIAGALAASPAAALGVFLTLGLGLAAPYAVLAVIPGLARALPRPGRWTEVLRQALAFPMYGASAWLIWVLSAQAGPRGVLAALAGLVLLGFVAWTLDVARNAARQGQRWGRVAAAAAGLGVVGLLAAVAAAPAPVPAARAEAGAEAFSAERLAALRAEGRPVLVNITAAWCITCQVNERVALTSRVRAAFMKSGITFMIGDWTRQDRAIGDYLAAFGRAGVPLYVFYPAGGGAPTTLPQILTEGVVLAAIGAPTS